MRRDHVLSGGAQRAELVRRRSLLLRNILSVKTRRGHDADVLRWRFRLPIVVVYIEPFLILHFHTGRARRGARWFVALDADSSVSVIRKVVHLCGALVGVRSGGLLVGVGHADLSGVEKVSLV